VKAPIGSGKTATLVITALHFADWKEKIVEKKTRR
jgi:hypothetical protein